MCPTFRVCQSNKTASIPGFCNLNSATHCLQEINELAKAII